jgi:antirestriction protein ArdC
MAEAFHTDIERAPDRTGSEHLPGCLVRNIRSAQAIASLLLEYADLPARTGRGRSGKSRRREAAPVREHVYDAITGRMIEALEAGTVPWQKPWGAAKARPRSMKTGKAYEGVNVLQLGRTSEERGYTSPWWGTYRQIEALGGHVMKGQNRKEGKGSTTIVWYDTREREEENEQTGELEIVTYPVAQAHQVFNAVQCEGLPERFYLQSEGEQVLAEPQAVLDGYLAHGPRLQHSAGDRAYYRIATDTITMPLRAQFTSPEHYYSTGFHEATHSTGHPSRLNRPGIAEFDHFGSGRYAKEELVAQMGASMLLAETGLDRPDLFESSAAYLQSWLGVLKNDRSLVVKAASQAQKAADLVIEPRRQAEPPVAEAPLPDREIEPEAGS